MAQDREGGTQKWAAKPPTVNEPIMILRTFFYIDAGYRASGSPAAEATAAEARHRLRAHPQKHNIPRQNPCGNRNFPKGNGVGNASLRNFPASVCATEAQPNLALQERMQPGPQGQAGVPATQGNTRSGKEVHFLLYHRQGSHKKQLETRIFRGRQARFTWVGPLIPTSRVHA